VRRKEPQHSDAGFVYKGTAIPMPYLVLNKQGNSSQRKRIALLQRFIAQFGRRGILGVLGDREFIGGHGWQGNVSTNKTFLSNSSSLINS